MLFYLGTHQPHWLGSVDVPLFVSHRTLLRRKALPRAAATWALDSGAFTELSQYGEWQTTEAEYIDAVYNYSDGIGRMAWAAPMDWMCEPFMLEHTGLTVEQHQRLTVQNVMNLWSDAPDLPFIPVLQGWSCEDYLLCVDMYERMGVDLTAEAVVGLGSVCRRQATVEVAEIVAELQPLRLHGFGVKTAGVGRLAPMLASADSLAWSFQARREGPLPGHSHMNCANCLDYAMIWRERLLGRISESERNNG